MTIDIEPKALEQSATPSHDTALEFLSSKDRYQVSEHVASVFKDHGLIDSAEWRKLIDVALSAYVDDLG
jgi:hypothetical protein